MSSRTIKLTDWNELVGQLDVGLDPRGLDQLYEKVNALLEEQFNATKRNIIVRVASGDESYPVPIESRSMDGATEVVTIAKPQSVGIVWPKTRDAGRIGDMSPSAALRIGFDSDNDVYVSVHDENGSGTVEFCNGGGGGGRSMRVREALIGVMVAIEEENGKTPSLDWWQQR